MNQQVLRTGGIEAARDFQELPAWQKAVTLAERVYALSEDHAGLVAHMRNTALIVASSIAAASGRNNEFGMSDSYSKAQSANAELMTQITLGRRLGYLDEDTASDLLLALDEVSRLIVGLKHGLKVAAKDAERGQREQERPRREYKPRDGGDRPARPYRNREGGEERPRREYKSREDRGEKKAYSNKKSYGDHKPYGDKKPYGDRKPYGGKSSGDRPYRKPRD